MVSFRICCLFYLFFGWLFKGEKGEDRWDGHGMMRGFKMGNGNLRVMVREKRNHGCFSSFFDCLGECGVGGEVGCEGRRERGGENFLFFC